MGPTWWVSDLFERDPALLVAWVFWVIFSITLHELGHGWAAIRYGDRTPIETGHMTWNPRVHMGKMSLLLFALVGIAWGAMPVNPSRLRGARGHADAVVAAAGPAMNLGLAALCVVGGALWLAYGGSAGLPDSADRFIRTFLRAGAFLNVALLLLNLAPVPPLDGSRILASYSRGYAALMSNPALSLAGFALVFMFGGRFLVPIASDAVSAAENAILSILPGVRKP